MQSIGSHGVLAAHGMSRYALPMSIRLEFALLLAGWLFGFANVLRYAL